MTFRGGRRYVYRNSASATAGEDIAAACHIRLASGVSLFRTTDKGGDMTSTTRIPPAEITGIKGALMKRMATKMMGQVRSEEHTSELQSRQYLVCRLLLEKKKNVPIWIV